jgi:hypothetical protein
MGVESVHARLDKSLRCGLSIRRHRPDGLFWRAAAHNRVLLDALAYMLISIPTASSTIFGAFQVMFSSFQVGASTRAFHTVACFAE